MTVRELNRFQLYCLKQNYICEKEENPSYLRLADADDIVSDDTIYNEYDGTEFVPDDFLDHR